MGIYVKSSSTSATSLTSSGGSKGLVWKPYSSYTNNKFDTFMCYIDTSNQYVMISYGTILSDSLVNILIGSDLISNLPNIANSVRIPLVGEDGSCCMVEYRPTLNNGASLKRISTEYQFLPRTTYHLASGMYPIK